MTFEHRADQSMDDLSRQNIHLVGACGTGMKALTELLLDAGCSVTGSDISCPNHSIQQSIQRGFVFYHGHLASNLSDVTQRLVYSSAVPPNNPERMEAERRGMSQFSYSQMVGQLMQTSIGVCIAGTHGKSTTTAMTASILNANGALFAVVLGAEMCDGGRSGWTGSGNLFVAESCEFQRSFLDFQPKYAALLSIETDHFDCYPDLESVESAFLEFANQVSSDGVLLFNADCPSCCSVSKKSTTRARRVSFGVDSPADWMAKGYQRDDGRTRFLLIERGTKSTEIDFRLQGIHNVKNGLAAAAICAEIGVPCEIIRESLRNFQGIRRRMEFVGEWNGVTFIDDYAHHPTAVKVTLGAIRETMGSRRIICVFQPHQVSRTLALIDDFAESFHNADELILAPVFAAREAVMNEPFLVSNELADRIVSKGVSARSFASLDQIVATLEDLSRPGDVIVTMGAGDIDRIHHEFTRRI